VRVMVVGSGGREHALAWKLRQSPQASEVFCLPGNDGMRGIASRVQGDPLDVEETVLRAEELGIDLVVVGPEAPLAAGLADAMERRGVTVFGPGARAAAIESSKVFAKNLMRDHDIPTALYRVFTDASEAQAYVRQVRPPLVVKADGLAAGKGVIVCRTTEEALAALSSIMREEVFGEAGRRVVVEEFLQGEEVSVLALTDGRRVLPLAPSQDHKAAYDGDRGPNTGGMGAYSPVPACPPSMLSRVLDEIIDPTVRAMEAEGRPYRGVLYAGLMLTEQGPKVLEFNCRFGDPETQVVLPRLAGDLLPALLAAARGDISKVDLDWRDEACAGVVLASGGYPGSYRKGKEITGLDELEDLGVTAFHSGTEYRDGRWFTAGGRVLCLTSLGSTIKEAREMAYRGVERVRFQGMHCRSDIALRAVSRNPG